MGHADSSWQLLETFLSGEISAVDLERWLTSTPDLESALGTRPYRELLAFDFRQPNAAQELQGLVRSIYESARPARLARDRAYRIARGLLSGSVQVHDGVRALAELCLDGHDWVPGVFVHLKWELDKIPRPEQYASWEPNALGAKLEEGRQMYRSRRPAILEAAREIISSYHREYGA